MQEELLIQCKSTLMPSRERTLSDYDTVVGIVSVFFLIGRILSVGCNNGSVPPKI